MDPADRRQLHDIYADFGFVSADGTLYCLEFFEPRGTAHEEALAVLARLGVTGTTRDDDIITFPRLPELELDEEF